MNWNVHSTADRKHRQTTIGLFMAALGLLALVGIAVFSGGAAAAEPVNSTVEVDNDTASIYVEATFADGINDSDATASVTIQNPDGTEFATGTVAGNASETVVEDWNVSDGDPTGNYSVVVTADSGIVDSAEAGTFADAAGGGGGDGSADDGSDGWGSVMGYPVWIVAVIGLGALAYAVREGWLEDLY